MSLRVSIVHVRVVCENTLIMALQDATISVATQHTGDVHTKLDFNLDVVAQMHAAQNTVTEAMRALADPKLKPEEVTRVLEAAYPTTRATSGVLTAKQLLGATITIDEANKAQLADKIKKNDDYLRQVAVYRDTAREVTGRDR
jgi:hypothetical protein